VTTGELLPGRGVAQAGAVPAARTVHAFPRARRHRLDLLPYVMVAPALLATTAFSLLPTLYGVLVSLYRVEFVELLTFVGARNYVEVLTDSRFWNSARVSFTFTACSVALTFVGGFGLALLGNQRVRFRTAFPNDRVAALGDVVRRHLPDLPLDFE